MVKRDELIKFILNYFGSEWLRKAEFKDELANGVQILGGDNVNKVTLGVSCNLDFLSEAVNSGSNFCIFHHGFDARTYKSQIPLYSQKRLKIIFKNDLSILGFHYILDAHPRIGNNATIIKELGAKIKEPFFQEFGYTAEFNTPQEVKKLAKKCSAILEHDVFAVYTEPEKVKTFGVCSGAGKPYAQEIKEMEAKGVELYISGETGESAPNKMKEVGINYFACGHYATEVFGVQELGKIIKSHFKNKLQVEFIDIPNPI